MGAGASQTQLEPDALAPNAKLCSGVDTGAQQRAPVAFQVTRLASDVLAHVRGAQLFTAPESELEAIGFTRNVDHPAQPDHIYYEGYFHALQASTPFRSINPRFGVDFDKPAAPLELTALVQAFKTVNSKVLKQVLPRNLASDPASALLRRLIASDRLFADLAVQIHFGDAIPPEYVGFHVDGANSILHMALSLGGRRALHSMQYQYNTPSSSEEHVVDWQEQGDVYLSSPFAIKHGVEYPQCDWENRVIAVQCRVLLTLDELVVLHQSGRGDALVQRVTAVLAMHPLRMPSLEEVMREEDRLRKVRRK